MKAPSKETRENWAMEQTDIILNSVLFAFTGAYDMASVYDLQNELVTNKELQESIFWKAMYDCIVVTDILDKYCLRAYRMNLTRSNNCVESDLRTRPVNTYRR